MVCGYMRISLCFNLLAGNIRTYTSIHNDKRTYRYGVHHIFNDYDNSPSHSCNKCFSVYLIQRRGGRESNNDDDDGDSNDVNDDG